MANIGLLSEMSIVVSRTFVMFLFSAAVQAGPNWQLPPGFDITPWADVPNARALALGERGTVFVGTRSDGRVFALQDTDADGKADKRWTVAEGLDMPTGVAIHQGALYVAESGAIWRYDAIEDHLDAPPEPTSIRHLTAYKHHGWRDIAFGPDEHLYVSLGAPCNICDPGDFGAIWRMAADGSDFEPYAMGVRNSVGLAFAPQDGYLWFTDNGRDWMGDDVPPDELNRAIGIGQHFGFPFCHGEDISDPEFGARRRCAAFEPPVQNLGAHVAALGLLFYTGDQFPSAYKGQILIAEHGSWNRSTPVGYRISRVRLENGRAVSYQPMVSGWLGPDGRVHGRPVDVLQLADGSVLISDDAAGRIWRLSYRPAAGR